jgi:hypothetical protein
MPLALFATVIPNNSFGEMFTTECNETVYNPFKFTSQWFIYVHIQYHRARR